MYYYTTRIFVFCSILSHISMLYNYTILLCHTTTAAATALYFCTIHYTKLHRLLRHGAYDLYKDDDKEHDETIMVCDV